MIWADICETDFKGFFFMGL